LAGFPANETTGFYAKEKPPSSQFGGFISKSKQLINLNKNHEKTLKLIAVRKFA
jgi:hypothetical protein